MSYKFEPGQRVEVAALVGFVPEDALYRKYGDPTGRVGFVMNRRVSTQGQNWYMLDCYGAWLNERTLFPAEEPMVAVSSWDDFTEVMRRIGENLDPTREPR